jgi:hypothetical protein
VPTLKIVDDMLQLASARKDDFVMDLGSGDGRLVITAPSVTARAAPASTSTPRW